MIKIVNSKVAETDKKSTVKISFIVADHDGVQALRHGELATQMEMEYLSCGHYIFPALGQFSHSRVNCPLCGTHYKPENPVDEKPSEVFAIHTEVIGHSKSDQKIINQMNNVVVGLKYVK